MGRILNGTDLTLDKPIELNRGSKSKVSINGLSISAFSEIWNGYEFFPLKESGCALYYPGYPGYGSTILDYSGNKNHGTISGAVWERLARGMWSLKYDGVDDYTTAANNNINITSAISLEAWVKPSLIAGEDRVIFSKAGVYFFQIDGTGKLEAYLYSTTSPGYHQRSDTIPLNVWTHTVLTYDGSSLLLYQNGSSQTFSTSGSLVSNGNPVQFGGQNDIRSFKGNTVCSRVYNKVLTANEIVLHYNSGYYYWNS